MDNYKDKVVLINPPQNTKYPQPPMGLALLGAVLEREGYKVSVLDLNVESSHNITRAISADVVGITAMTPTINNAMRIVKELKFYNKGLPIILGGVHATLLPEETLKTCPEIDTIVVGEGDNAIIEVLRNDTRGIYQSQEKVDMDSLPHLAYHLLPWQKYKPHPPHGRAYPFVAMLTSRGCPYHCSYCSKEVFGNKFRAQSPMRVVDEVADYIERFGTKEIAFYDDVFTLDKERAYGVAEEILRRGLKVCWTCETRANLVDRELLKQMKKAGCYSIAYGIESASQDILDIIDKDITLEQAEEGVGLTREAGIQTIGYFMIGSPNETPETIRQTIALAKKLKLDYAQFAITTPFPRTKLFEYYQKGEVNMDIPWENFVYAGTGNKVSPIFESEALGRGDIEYWVSKAYKDFYIRLPYIWQRLTRIRSIGDMKVLAKGLSMLAGNVK